MPDERERAAQLVAAEEKAEILFAEVTRRGLIAAGERESAVSDRVRDLGAELFGEPSQTGVPDSSGRLRRSG